MRVKVSTLLNAPVDRVWDTVKKPQTLVRVSRGVMRFGGADKWPSEWREGEDVETRFFFFGFLPAFWVHHLRVVRLNDQRREVLTNERGGLIHRWDHFIQVDEEAEGRSRYTDRIEIGAGLLTPVVWAYAHLFYRYRQMNWRRLARELR